MKVASGFFLGWDFVQGEPLGEAEEAALNLLMWKVPVLEDTITQILVLGLGPLPLLPGAYRLYHVCTYCL